MKNLLLLFLLLLSIPFILNLYHGYLKPVSGDKIDIINCDRLSHMLKPHIDDMIQVIENHGKFLSTKNNFNKSEGFKIVRSDIKPHLPNVFEIIDEYVKNIKVDGMKMANCDTEKYCWFLRLYNRDGHFLDWHYDNNFTSGLRYTYVCNIYVSDNNESQFLVKNDTNKMRVINNTSGQGVFYNGSEVKHAISKQNKNATRIALVVPFYEHDKLTYIGRWRKWARDIIYSTLKL